MDFSDSLLNKPVQNEDLFAYNPSMPDRQVVVKKFRMSDLSLDFIIATKANPEYDFKEQFVDKIIQANPRFSEDALNGIATTVAIIDRELVPANQMKSYAFSLKGSNGRFQNLENESIREKHLTTIIYSARVLGIRQLISNYIVSSVSYRLDNNALDVRMANGFQFDMFL